MQLETLGAKFSATFWRVFPTAQNFPEQSGRVAFWLPSVAFSGSGSGLSVAPSASLSRPWRVAPVARVRRSPWLVLVLVAPVLVALGLPSVALP